MSTNRPNASGKAPSRTAGGKVGKAATTGRQAKSAASQDKDPEDRYVALQGRGTLTIPADIRRALHLDQPGAMAQLVIRDDGVLEVRPKVPVDADQAWFWSDRWQQMEREADKDIAAGRVARYDDADDFLAALDTL